MKRIWFKKDMAQRIREGKKTATTRYKTRDTGDYQAVEGSRYKPKVFAIITIWSINHNMKWSDVISSCYEREGFSSAKEMEDYLLKEKLIKHSLLDDVVFHQFKVKELMN